MPGAAGANGWKKESLSDVTLVIDCKHRTPVYVEVGIPLVSPGTIKWGALDLVSPVKRVGKEEYELNGPRSISVT